MRKAISFSGQSRFVLEGYNTLKKNLKDFDSYDIFIHTWFGDLTKDIFLYEPKYYAVEPQRQVVPDTVKEYTNAHFVHFSMFYSMKKSLEFLQKYEQDNNFKYDVVIRTRFDIDLESQLDPCSFDLNEGVYSPDVCGNPAVISDWFNFGSSNNIKVYSEIYDNIIEFHKQGVMITSGEELITHMLKIRNIPIKKIPCDMYLLRDRKIHSFLSKNWKYAN